MLEQLLAQAAAEEKNSTPAAAKGQWPNKRNRTTTDADNEEDIDVDEEADDDM